MEENIVEEKTVKKMSGHNEGELLLSDEIIKGDFDENNVLIGWHKEDVKEKSKK